jgi:hypothetical protein
MPVRIPTNPMKKNSAYRVILHAFVAIASCSPLFINAARATPAEDLFRTFSACDRGFFDKLAAEPDSWSTSMTLEGSSGVMFPVVPDRLRDGRKVQRFQHPLMVGDVELLGYLDDIYEVGGQGKFFDWGFIVKGEKAEIAQKLAPYIADHDQFLPSTDNTWQRGQHWNSGEPVDHWHDGVTPMGQAPAPGTVERVLYVDEGGNDMIAGKGEVEVNCSVQGAVTPELLRQLRPDLDRAAMDVATHSASLASTTPTSVTAHSGSFKITLPAGWTSFIPVGAEQAPMFEIYAKRSDNGPFLFIKSVNALDIVDWVAYSNMYLTGANKNLSPDAAIKYTTVKVNGSDALRADFSMIQGGINMHTVITSIKNDKQILIVLTVVPEVLFTANRAEMERLAQAIQF